ncbi:hypothetical protein K449DRAFT_439311 [Hypoxylon sp. EC38]|nr:hypothetical protein K449DRAFT_439311 [Hypoxylon sp. EC38]
MGGMNSRCPYVSHQVAANTRTASSMQLFVKIGSRNEKKNLEELGWNLCRSYDYFKAFGGANWFVGGPLWVGLLFLMKIEDFLSHRGLLRSGNPPKRRPRTFLKISHRQGTRSLHFLLYTHTSSLILEESILLCTELASSLDWVGTVVVAGRNQERLQPEWSDTLEWVPLLSSGLIPLEAIRLFPVMDKRRGTVKKPKKKSRLAERLENACSRRWVSMHPSLKKVAAAALWVPNLKGSVSQSLPTWVPFL